MVLVFSAFISTIFSAQLPLPHKTSKPNENHFTLWKDVYFQNTIISLFAYPDLFHFPFLRFSSVSRLKWTSYTALLCWVSVCLLLHKFAAVLWSMKSLGATVISLKCNFRCTKAWVWLIETDEEKSDQTFASSFCLFCSQLAVLNTVYEKLCYQEWYWF